MSGCNSDYFRNMLHKYELGVLNEEEQQEFELHLYSCDSCMQEVQAMADATLYFRQDKIVQDTIHELAASDISQPHNHARRRLMPAGVTLIAVVTLLLVLFSPWKIEITDNRDALAITDRIAIMSFTNLSNADDSSRIDEIITNLLITNMAESQYLKVVSWQRLEETLAYLEIAPDQEIGHDEYRRIADEISAKTIIFGTVVQDEPSLILTCQMIDVETGNVFASCRIAGLPGGDIFSIVDSLALCIRNNINKNNQYRTTALNTAEITTGSAEAYRHYLDGIKLMDQYYFLNATQQFHEAISVDSTFAMAYYYLSLCEIDRHQKSAALAQALKYIDKAGKRDQYYIRSRQASLSGNYNQAIIELQNLIAEYPDSHEAYYRIADIYYSLGDFEQANTHLHKTVEIDPLYKRAFNLLGYSFLHLNECDSALQAIDRYIVIAPKEPNPYDSKGDIYRQCGIIDSAEVWYLAAVSVNRSYIPARFHLSELYLLQGRYADANEMLDWIDKSPQIQDHSNADFYRAAIELRKGKFIDALDILDRGIENDQAAGMGNISIRKHWMKHLIYLELKEYSKALEEIERCQLIHNVVRPDDQLGYNHYRAYILVQQGDIARAEGIANNILSNLSGTGLESFGYGYIMGAIEMKRGNPAKALEYYQRFGDGRDRYAAQFLLAQAYLANGDLEKSKEIFLALSSGYSDIRIHWGPWDCRIDYYLGQIYEQSGENEKAIEYYRAFDRLWGNTKQSIEEVEITKDKILQLESRI